MTDTAEVTIAGDCTSQFAKVRDAFAANFANHAETANNHAMELSAPPGIVTADQADAFLEDAECLQGARSDSPLVILPSGQIRVYLEVMRCPFLKLHLLCKHPIKFQFPEYPWKRLACLT